MQKNNYYYYCIARNRAWEVLNECKISSLPLDLNLIKKHYAINIIPYSKSTNYCLFCDEMKTGDGFSAIVNNQKIVYFNDSVKSKARIRFTIAHELGHCLLNHDLNKTKYRNSELDFASDSIDEMQANVFARDILMPAIVLHYEKCLSYLDIMQLCEVSETSAKIREERMRVLEERDKFCLSYLEREVYKNFFN